MLLHVGFDSYVVSDRIIAIVPYGASKIKNEVAKRRKNADETRKVFLQDCTKNHVIKSVVICDDGTYILSSVSTPALVRRFYNEKSDDA